MNEARTVSSQVEVAVDPGTAFTVFTEELDLWWVRGPINHHAAGRMRELRCEPGVGGRLLEVYDDDALELAQITVWDPGSLLAWTSSIDDVRTTIHFEQSDVGTLVRVVAEIPAGGQERGGLSWTRTVPKWFPRWVDRRDHEPHEVRDLARLGLAISYAKPAAAARWLADVFGFESPDPLPTAPDPLPESSYGHPWIEFRIGNSSLIVNKRYEERVEHAPIHLPWVYVDDVAEHFRHAQAGGATIVEKLDSPWGLPFYIADDLEGNRWTFAQARPTM